MAGGRGSACRKLERRLPYGRNQLQVRGRCRKKEKTDSDTRLNLLQKNNRIPVVTCTIAAISLSHTRLSLLSLDQICKTKLLQLSVMLLKNSSVLRSWPNLVKTLPWTLEPPSIHVT